MKTKLKVKRAFFKAIKFIAPSFFFCALFCLWNVVSLHIPPFCSIIILALIVLGSVSILVLDCYQLFRNHWIKFLFFLACACWGIWIYNHVDSLPSGKFNVWLRTLNAINNALSSFFVSRGDYQVHLMPDDLTTHGYILFHCALLPCRYLEGNSSIASMASSLFLCPLMPSGQRRGARRQRHYAEAS